MRNSRCAVVNAGTTRRVERKLMIIARTRRGRYQDGPTAVPRSTLAPDWQGRPRSGYVSSIAHIHEGRMWPV